MPKTAKERFDATIERCNDLLSLFDNVKNDDLLRSAVVLSVAALDMYAADRFMENFVPYVKSHPHQIEESALFLQKAGMTLSDALILLCKKGDRPFRSIRAIVERGYEKKSLHSMDRIDELYAFYHLRQITNNACCRVRIKTLRKRIEELVRRRHEIAHEADYGGKNHLQVITMPWVQKRIEYLCRFVAQFDKIVTVKLNVNGRKKQ